MAGVTVDGFVSKTQEEIRAEMDADAKSAYGTSVGVSDDDFFGRLFAIMSERLALLWEVAEAVNAASDPDSNTGAQQDSIAAISGAVREAATNSTDTLTLTGVNATLVTSGSQASLSTTLERFTTLANATLVTTVAWATSTAYVLNDRRTNGGNVYIVTVAGTSAGSGGPTGTGTAIVDNTVTWRFVGVGTADIDVAAQAANTGPVVAAAYDIDTIETSVSGWDGVANLLDAVEGTNNETAEAFRLRREDELAKAGTTPRDPLRVDLLEVADVTTVKLFINDTDTTDADGVPPHAFEALIQGGTDQAIWDRLLSAKSAGAKTHGTEIGTATDSEGNAIAMAFSRPTETDIYCELTYTYDADLYPTDGDAQVKAAIVAFGDAQSTGKDVVSSSVAAQAFVAAVGVLDVTLAYINTSAPAIAETTIAIGLRELAVYDTSRIVINSSAATP